MPNPDDGGAPLATDPEVGGGAASAARDGADDARGAGDDARDVVTVASPSPSPSPSPSTPHRRDSMPTLDVVLDPRSSPPGVIAAGRDASARSLSPTMTALAGLFAGLLALACIFAPLVLLRPGAQPLFAPLLLDSSAKLSTPGAGVASPEAGAVSPGASAAGSATPPPEAPARIARPGPWRITALSAEPGVKLIEGAMERRSFVDALSSASVPRGQVYRLLKAFEGVRSFEKSKRHDAFVVALDRGTRRVTAFEYRASPIEIYQAREQEGGALHAERLDLQVEKGRATVGMVVGDDLRASLERAGFDASILELLEDALEGRAQLSSFTKGAELRIVAQEETALGVFARYADVEAAEYRPAGATGTALRVYHFLGKRTQGYFDAKGRQPYKGGFRLPIPLAKVSSRFNMHRMHPILHVVMPHNGVDFAAAAGTPVYSACFGKIASVGEAGPSGNLVTIQHDDGITTGYAHLSRFAANLRVGQQVDSRQLIGYVGSTGRSTGPHLHFSAKKNGVFIDPLTLKLDGERVLPKPERAAFDETRAALDVVLEAIVLPNAPPHTAEAPEEPGKDDLEPLELPEDRDP